MRAPWRHIPPGRTGLAALGLAGMLSLGACDRHDEAGARALAAGWFDIGETLYFDSRRSCTAAVFRATSGDVKSRLPFFGAVDAIFTNGKQAGPFALSVPEKSADALFIDIMNADRPTGVAIQSAGVEAKPCMDERARATFYNALTAQPSVLVFSAADGAFALLDPVRRLVVLTSGGN